MTLVKPLDSITPFSVYELSAIPYPWSDIIAHTPRLLFPISSVLVVAFAEPLNIIGALGS